MTEQMMREGASGAWIRDESGNWNDIDEYKRRQNFYYVLRVLWGEEVAREISGHDPERMIKNVEPKQFKILSKNEDGTVTVEG